MLKTRFAVLILITSCASLAFGQTADSLFLGTRWDKPVAGVDQAANAPQFGGTYGPGEADWSIMGPGLAPTFDNHPGISMAFDTLLPAEPAGTAAVLFAQALQIWSDASVTPGLPGSGFKIKPKVNDGDGDVGQGGPNPPINLGNGIDGDIRAGVFPFPDLVPSSKPDFDVIAHGFYPDTDAQKLFHAIGASKGGDTHFRPHVTVLPNGGVDWINWQVGMPVPPANKVDLLSVMLHEVGHAIGLGHNLVQDMQNPDNNVPADPLSVMVPVYQGVRQALSQSDIANVRLLYRPTGALPEPTSLGMLITLIAALSCVARPSR